MTYEQFKTLKHGTELIVEGEDRRKYYGILAISFNGERTVRYEKNTDEDLYIFERYHSIEDEEDFDDIKSIELAPKTLYNLVPGDYVVDIYDRKRRVLAVNNRDGEYTLYQVSARDDFDIADADFTVTDFENKGYKPVQPDLVKDEETPEFTMEEACEKMGYKFKIKK